MPNKKRASQIKDAKIKNKDVTDVSSIEEHVSSTEVIKDMINKTVEEYKAFYDNETLALKIELEDIKKSEFHKHKL